MPRPQTQSPTDRLTAAGLAIAEGFAHTVKVAKAAVAARRRAMVPVLVPLKVSENRRRPRT